MTSPAPEERTGDWPSRLLQDIADAPLVPEHILPSYKGGDPHRTTLTDVEKRVLTGLAVGLTMEMVADVYGISIETVKTQLKTARFTLRAKNTTHAVALALRQGQIT